MSLSQKGSFAADCGLSGPLQLHVFSRGSPPQRHSFASPCVVIGQGPGATLSLGDSAVSRRHVYLQALEGRLFAVDLDSRSGITLTGMPAVSGWLDAGRRLGVGPFEIESLVTTFSALTGSEQVDCPLQSKRAVSASFEVFRGEERLAVWRMNRLLALVGSSSQCRIRLPGTAISRIHCSLVSTPQGIWVVDISSRKGTWFRGAPIQAVRLDDGDAFEVGPYRLRVYYQNSLSQPSPSMSEAAQELASAAARPQAAPVVVFGTENPGLLTPQAALAPRPEQLFMGAMVQQFTTLQQQMFDQFQQVLMTLVQMMSSMHQEQASLIREELAEFQKATQELHRLQEQLRQPPPSPAVAPRAETNGSPSPAPVPPGKPWPALTAPAAPTTPTTPTAPVASPPEADNGGGASSGENVQEWLNQRIAELQTERQGSWDRLLNFLRVS